MGLTEAQWGARLRDRENSHLHNGVFLVFKFLIAVRMLARRMHQHIKPVVMAIMETGCNKTLGQQARSHRPETFTSQDRLLVSYRQYRRSSLVGDNAMQVLFLLMAVHIWV